MTSLKKVQRAAVKRKCGKTLDSFITKHTFMMTEDQARFTEKVNREIRREGWIVEYWSGFSWKLSRANSMKPRMGIQEAMDVAKRFQEISASVNCLYRVRDLKTGNILPAVIL